jgi:hypothetical protein
VDKELNLKGSKVFAEKVLGFVETENFFFPYEKLVNTINIFFVFF